MAMHADRDASEILHVTAELADDEIVARVRAGDHRLFEILMRRHNQRLYRAARAILQDESEIEDAMQQAYMNAFSHLHQFEARAQFSTWLMRILINEASRRRRARQRDRHAPQATCEKLAFAARASESSPEYLAYANELQRALEHAIDALPETYRLVFVLREVEGLSTSETALALGVGDEAVKTRLHRGRVMVRRGITDRIGVVAATAFPFHAPRCDRVVARVLAWMAE
jgi:RNA polymerase sigma-70 factor (ECF subfamily)